MDGFHAEEDFVSLFEKTLNNASTQAGNGLDLFNEALANGESSYRIVNVKRRITERRGKRSHGK